MGYLRLADHGNGRARGESDAGESVSRASRKPLNGRARAAAKSSVDLVLMVGAAGWAWLICSARTSGECSPWRFVAAIALVRLLVYLGMRLHRRPWRQASSHDALWLAGSAALGVPALAAVFYGLPSLLGVVRFPFPHLVLMTEPALYLTLLGGARVGARGVVSSYRRRQTGAKRVLIAGTGDAARSLVWQIQNSESEYQVVGMVDDDPERQGETVLGVPVLGTIPDLVALAPRLEADQVVIAIPSLSPERLREVVALCEPTKLPVRILPPLRELMDGGVSVAALREVRMEDLLPRSEVKLDRQAITNYLRGRTVLVTGGGGSIGGELCRQALRVGARRLLVLGRGENSVFEITQELAAHREECEGECEVLPVICDVQDRRALREVFQRHRPDVVFHAAAHKHVPLMEQHPAEAIRNNVLGTLNVATLAVEFLVSRFVLVSTDKAVNPTSVMGATKRVAEKIVKGFAVAKNANMVSVRFGNVLGSRGSVVPMMKRQIERGKPVTVTDPEMVRYFMTIPEATQLLLQAGAMGGRGEVFVLDMGHPVRVLDLAKDLIRRSGLVPGRDIPIRIIGRRPGEKLREDLLNQMETERAKKNGQFYIAPAEPVDLCELLGQIKQLRMAAEMHHHDWAVRLLQEVVPTFSPEAARETEPGSETALVGQAA
jgi:FlaA1/EpsC-like NDP-sugar epimerase